MQELGWLGWGPKLIVAAIGAGSRDRMLAPGRMGRLGTGVSPAL